MTWHRDFEFRFSPEYNRINLYISFSNNNQVAKIFSNKEKNHIILFDWLTHIPYIFEVSKHQNIYIKIEIHHNTSSSIDPIIDEDTISLSKDVVVYLPFSDFFFCFFLEEKLECQLNIDYWISIGLVFFCLLLAGFHRNQKILSSFWFRIEIIDDFPE